MISLLFIVHFIADFLLQSREIAKTKSENWKSLGIHILIIFICFLPFGLVFSSLNALIHAVIDKFIWSFYKKYAMKCIQTHKKPELYKEPEECRCGRVGYIWHYWEDHVFYSFIGLDQLLHGLTLVLLWSILC